MARLTSQSMQQTLSLTCSLETQKGAERMFGEGDASLAFSTHLNLKMDQKITGCLHMPPTPTQHNGSTDFAPLAKKDNRKGNTLRYTEALCTQTLKGRRDAHSNGFS